jgi:MoaA/NifB/PqqE/SkfB family radical SAM enzyme
MNLQQALQKLKNQYLIIGQIDLDQWHKLATHRRESWLREQLQSLRLDQFTQNQRIVLTLVEGDDYSDDQEPGNIMRCLQQQLNQVDITNFFVALITNQSQDQIAAIQQWFKDYSTDTTSIEICQIDQPVLMNKKNYSAKTGYRYNSVEPIHIRLDQLTEREEYLLTQSETFCIYPWIHVHAYPTGEAYPCCHAEMKTGMVGNCRTQTLEEIWTGEPMQLLRENMLAERKHAACTRCYEQESAGFFSGRKSANKHHGHHIKKLEENPFELTYWDIRFSNLCNLRCRSCGHIFSSQWYQDQAKLVGPEWKLNNSVLNYAGRTETDMWQQLEPHLDYVEQIYFAGGEPLLMEEHYRILDELVRRERFDVRLIYNTNFTHTDLKGRSVFEYWKLFDSVAVGASLDASGARGEYIRKGTVWSDVERNREDMLRICPDVDFYISPTLSIMNALHLPEFHRDWTERGLIRAQDLNVNILQDPAHYRIDVAPAHYKYELQAAFDDHLAWLRPRDTLQRATVGFESAVTFMNASDNSHLLDQFWAKTAKLDAIRNENILTVIPELGTMK